MTQKALAARVGLSPQAISKLERPQQNLTLGTLRRYLSALDYTVESELSHMRLHGYCQSARQAFILRCST